jgi:hypothetical protein
MKLKVVMLNSGGCVDERVVEGPDEEAAGIAAKAALLEMLETVPYLAEDDTFAVSRAD